MRAQKKKDRKYLANKFRWVMVVERDYECTKYALLWRCKNLGVWIHFLWLGKKRRERNVKGDELLRRMKTCAFGFEYL